MRALHFTLGSLALVLAFAGAVLPLLPATPFALLASWSFARSSPRFAVWLQRLRWIGPVLADWERHRAIRPHVRWVAWLGLALGVSASLASGAIDGTRVPLVLSCAALAALVVARLPVLRPAQTTHAC